MRVDQPELGVRVRYDAWPRTAPGTPSHARSISVWCARDQHRAMTDAKAGREVEPADCENPVQEHFEAGQRVGVRGTPTVALRTAPLPYRVLKPVDTVETWPNRQGLDPGASAGDAPAAGSSVA